MGYLTTITFLNDASHCYKENPTRLAEIIDDAVSNHQCMRNGGHSYSESIGNHCNPITVQRTRHADDRTMYIHMGNCVTEFNPSSADTDKMLKHFPKVFDKGIDFIEQQLKELKKMRKEHLAKMYNNSPDGLKELRETVANLRAKMKQDGTYNKIELVKVIREATGKNLADAIEFLETV